LWWHLSFGAGASSLGKGLLISRDALNATRGHENILKNVSLRVAKVARESLDSIVIWPKAKLQ
jgi:hypothetical protein